MTYSTLPYLNSFGLVSTDKEFSYLAMVKILIECLSLNLSELIWILYQTELQNLQ